MIKMLELRAKPAYTIAKTTKLAASIVGGYLWTVYGPFATFMYGAVFAVAGLITLTFVPRK